MSNVDKTRRDFTLTWTLDAPRAQVFRSWTDPDHLDWYYNDAQPIPDEPIEVDLRVGGVWRQRMVIDESTSFVTGGVYQEIVPDERLVFAWGATDGWPKLDRDNLADSPLVTVTLSQSNGHTEMTVHVELPASLSEHEVRELFAMGVREGWRDTVDRLAASIERSRAAV
jgi:uncharacterized protein YndB with AHSA1/START domain